MSSSTAIFAAYDLDQTLAYYRDVLGFEIAWSWGEPASMAAVRMGGINIMIALIPSLAERIRGHQHWLNIKDVDALYEMHRTRQARIFSEIEDKPWGFREYTVEDPNGYHLRFTGSPTPSKSQPFPEGVTVVQRKPTSAEHLEIAGEAFGYRESMTEVLERSWDGVVALSPTGETIGVLRIMWDAPGWFSIWDVAVLPNWQGQNVGTQMMKNALDRIREVSPGAAVYLFTSKHGFYENLGFADESVSMLRL
jgi:ribosomal protein S18 acetylase RimI-like enzyme